jgi:hypothetical protein
MCTPPPSCEVLVMTIPRMRGNKGYFVFKKTSSSWVSAAEVAEVAQACYHSSKPAPDK